MCGAVLPHQADVVVNELVLDTETSDLNNVNGLTECTCCVQCKHTLETVLQEVSPATKIIQLLKEDINSKTVNNVVNTTENVTNREMNYDSRNVDLRKFSFDQDIAVCAVKLSDDTSYNISILSTYTASSGNFVHFLNKLEMILNLL
jgi:hypothetical protein